MIMAEIEDAEAGIERTTWELENFSDAQRSQRRQERYYRKPAAVRR